MEQQLMRTPYLVGDSYTIADIALYAYTHVAHEGGFDLSGFPAINAWLARVASHPRHVACTTETMSVELLSARLHLRPLGLQEARRCAAIRRCWAACTSCRACSTAGWRTCWPANPVS